MIVWTISVLASDVVLWDGSLLPEAKSGGSVKCLKWRFSPRVYFNICWFNPSLSRPRSCLLPAKAWQHFNRYFINIISFAKLLCKIRFKCSCTKELWVKNSSLVVSVLMSRLASPSGTDWGQWGQCNADTCLRTSSCPAYSYCPCSLYLHTTMALFYDKTILLIIISIISQSPPQQQVPTPTSTTITQANK